MMATVPHVTSGLGLRKFQGDGFLLTRVHKGPPLIRILSQMGPFHNVPHFNIISQIHVGPPSGFFPSMLSREDLAFSKGFFPWLKGQGNEYDCSPAFIAKDKNACSCTSTPPYTYAFMACNGTTSDNFTYTPYTIFLSLSCPTCLILYFFTPIIFGEEYKSRRPS